MDEASPHTGHPNSDPQAGHIDTGIMSDRFEHDVHTGAVVYETIHILDPEHDQPHEHAPHHSNGHGVEPSHPDQASRPLVHDGEKRSHASQEQQIKEDGEALRAAERVLGTPAPGKRIDDVEEAHGRALMDEAERNALIELARQPKKDRKKEYEDLQQQITQLFIDRYGKIKGLHDPEEGGKGIVRMFADPRAPRAHLEAIARVRERLHVGDQPLVVFDTPNPKESLKSSLGSTDYIYPAGEDTEDGSGKKPFADVDGKKMYMYAVERRTPNKGALISFNIIAIPASVGELLHELEKKPANIGGRVARTFKAAMAEDGTYENASEGLSALLNGLERMRLVDNRFFDDTRVDWKYRRVIWGHVHPYWAGSLPHNDHSATPLVDIIPDELRNLYIHRPEAGEKAKTRKARFYDGHMYARGEVRSTDKVNGPHIAQRGKGDVH